MAMTAGGIAKLMEECGELTAVLGKILAYPSGVHPYGNGDLFVRLAEELADVQAAVTFVAEKRQIDLTARTNKKLTLYRVWDSDADNQPWAVAS
jgi:NTP pyrophosphatase (non-canonical NTP hydrolase)